MNGLDVAIALTACFAFVGGYRRGLLARFVLWVVVVGIAFLAAQNMDVLVSLVRGGDSPAKPIHIIGVMAAALVVGRLIGGVVGSWVRSRIPSKPLRWLDRTAGGLVGVAGVALSVFLVTPILSFIPGWPSGTVKASAIATKVDEYAPVRLSAVQTVRRLLANGSLPIAIDELRRVVDGGRAPKSVELESNVEDQVRAATVKVMSVGCGMQATGTGFFVDSRRVITNAHVLAGTRSITLDRDGSPTPARLVGFDPARDLAILETEGTGGSAILRPREAKDGETGAVFGYRNGGVLAIRPARVAATNDETGLDIYDDRRATRNTVTFAANLGPGDSGGPLVSNDGALLGVVFSIATDKPSTAFALSSQELVDFLETLPRASKQVRSGRCIV